MWKITHTHTLIVLQQRRDREGGDGGVGGGEWNSIHCTGRGRRGSLRRGPEVSDSDGSQRLMNWFSLDIRRSNSIRCTPPPPLFFSSPDNLNEIWGFNRRLIASMGRAEMFKEHYCNMLSSCRCITLMLSGHFSLWTHNL